MRAKRRWLSPAAENPTAVEHETLIGIVEPGKPIISDSGMHTSVFGRSNDSLRVTLLGLVVSLLLFGCPPSGPNSASSGECNINEENCGAILVPGVAITLGASPRPVQTMTNHEFIVTLSDRDGPLEGARVEMDLTMPGMYMGENHLVLSDDGQGQYRASTVIPRCPSGETLWRADIRVGMRDVDGETWFLFRVK